MKRGKKKSCGTIRNKDGDHVILNPCIESQRHIHSFCLSRENI